MFNFDEQRFLDTQKGAINKKDSINQIIETRIIFSLLAQVEWVFCLIQLLNLPALEVISHSIGS